MGSNPADISSGSVHCDITHCNITYNMVVKPDAVLIIGFTGLPADDRISPDDIVYRGGDADIIRQRWQPELVDIEDIRESDKLFLDLVK